MLTFMIKFFAIVHFFCIGCLIFYGGHRIWLLLCWYQIIRRPESPLLNQKIPEPLPRVTIQLPVYNEQFVVARLLEAAAGISWPGHLLEIQVLDDSTDETCLIVDEKVRFLQKKGLDIKVLRRKNRQGFKAGALAHGLKSAAGEFIAIFDADFVPPDDFLKKTIPCFSNHDTGMVQARWGFLNTSHSWLTRVQTLLIGHHFDIEHRVRFSKQLFFNFNGTAGVWRKSAIADSGGWQSDTVTEDLDLSYRAQQKGWKFIYLHDYTVPSELPVTMSAFRAQQQRWAMGSVQTAIKILPGLIRSRLPFSVKREALFHLLANFYWVIGCISILTLFPAIVWRIGIGPLQIICFDFPLFLASAGAILLYFYLYAASISISKQGLKTKTSFRFLIVPLLCIGLAPGITFKILQGGFKKGGTFNRTPKFGITGKGFLPDRAGSYRIGILPDFLLNLPIALYTLIPLIFAWQRETWLALPLLFLFPLGFLLVIASDLKEQAGI